MTRDRCPASARLAERPRERRVQRVRHIAREAGQEIERLRGRVQEKGLAIVPLKIYFSKSGIVKVDLAVGRGKKLYDKRSDIKKKQTAREIDRAIKNRNRK